MQYPLAASQSVKCQHIRKRICSLRLMHTRFARRNEYPEIFIFGKTMFDSSTRVCIMKTPAKPKQYIPHAGNFLLWQEKRAGIPALCILTYVRLPRQTSSLQFSQHGADELLRLIIVILSQFSPRFFTAVLNDRRQLIHKKIIQLCQRFLDIIILQIG